MPPTEEMPPTGEMPTDEMLSTEEMPPTDQGAAARPGRDGQNGPVTTWRDGSPPDAGGARPVGQALAAEVRRLGGPDLQVTGAVFGRWAEVVGPAVADHSRPRTLRQGVLTVEVDEPAWATELRWLAPQVLERIGSAVGTGAVTELVVRVRGERPPRPAGRGRRGGPEDRG